MDRFFTGTLQDRDSGWAGAEEAVWRVCTAPAAYEAACDDVFFDDGYDDEEPDG